MHPYIGLKATRPAHAKNVTITEIVGVIVNVGLAGSSEDGLDTYATILKDDGTHTDVMLCSIVVDPVEAKARLAVVVPS